MLVLTLPIFFACNSALYSRYILNEQDAAAAIRQLLQKGVRDASFMQAFSKENVLGTIFPEPVKKVLNTVNQLGLTSEVDRFTTTLSTAAVKSAERSVPVFLNSIESMKLVDAMRIIKSGGTSATDYLRSSAGDSLRRAIKPVMEEALKEYKLDEQWDNIIKPVKGISGNRINIDLATLMAGAVSEVMFRSLEAKEQEIRNEAAARTTPLLQKVFSRSWN